MPLESVVLAMKTLRIDHIPAFPFPTPPPPDALVAAVRTLVDIGALVPVVKPAPTPASSPDPAAAPSQPAPIVVGEALTPLGSKLAAIPLHPALGKMLVLAASHPRAAAGGASTNGWMDTVVALVAAMSAQEPFVMPSLAPQVTKAATGEARDDDDEPNGAVDESDDDEEGVRGDHVDASVAGAAARAKAALQADLDEEDGGAAAAAAAAAAARRKAAEEAAREERRKLRAAAAAAHAKFRHPLSDGLTALRAYGAYAHVLAREGQAAAVAFCKAHWLRIKAMQEAHQLRKQLHGLVSSASPSFTSRADGDAAHATAVGDSSGDTVEDAEAGVADEGAVAGAGAGAAERKLVKPPSKRPFVATISPPDTATETLLRHLIAAGFVNRIAKRAPPSAVEVAAAAAKAGKGPSWVPYQASVGHLPMSLYVQRHSAVFDPDPDALPSYVVYSEVVFSRRPYLTGITVVEAEALHDIAAGTPRIRFGPPLDTPAPKYDPKGDTVTCWRVPSFGDASWQLPPVSVPLPQDDTAGQQAALRCFARAFVEGAVAAPLLPFGSRLVMSPATITKQTPQKRAVLLLHALQHPPAATGVPCVRTRADLAAVWRTVPSFLCTQFKAWLPLEAHSEVDAAWPAAVASLCALPAALTKHRK